MSSCSRDRRKVWALVSVKYCFENNVLHGFPLASVHPHVATLKAFLIADCRGVDEHAADNYCGVPMTSGVALFKVVSVDSTSWKESGSTGIPSSWKSLDSSTSPGESDSEIVSIIQKCLFVHCLLMLTSLTACHWLLWTYNKFYARLWVVFSVCLL